MKKLYLLIVRIYGGKEKWEKSKLRCCIHPIWMFIERKYRISSFYAKYICAIAYEKQKRLDMNLPHMKLNDYIKIFFNPFALKMPMIECSVGLKCTLQCKHCNQYNYLLKNKEYFDMNKTISYLQKVLDAVDYIYEISIAGGEALCAPNLEKLIKFINSSKKIGYLVVVTNGTIVPTNEVITVLKSPKILLSISNYPLEDTENRKKLYEICQENAINILNNNKNSLWADFGSLDNRSYTKTQREVAFAECWLKDVPNLIDGKIFRCEKIYVLNNLGIRNMNKGEYICIDDCKNTKQLRRYLNRMYKIKSLNACSHCNLPKERNIVPSGVQIEKD